MYTFNLSDILKIKIRKLSKKDKKRVIIINKKIREIITSEDIKRYKNLKYEHKNLKRVHIDKHFVLTFSVNKKTKHIIFVDFDHHDVIY